MILSARVQAAALTLQSMSSMSGVGVVSLCLL